MTGRLRTSDKVLAILRLFTVERPEWSVDEAGAELGLSQSTAYEHFRSLGEAGLIVASRTGRYVIGPAVIVYDRLSRMSDPLLAAAKPKLKALTRGASIPCVALLCRIYRMTVLCVDQDIARGADFAVGYERGRPMPLARGAASKVILAHLDRRKLRRFFEESRDEIASAGLGMDWGEFRASMRVLRATGAVITRGEVDAGRVGISAPIFLEDEVIASLSLVMDGQELEAKAIEQRLAGQVAAAAHGVTAALARSPS